MPFGEVEGVAVVDSGAAVGHVGDHQIAREVDVVGAHRDVLDADEVDDVVDVV